ncbi:MAG: hypothetical protein ACR2OJ_07880 [Hyphomicrobiales bacterium]
MLYIDIPTSSEFKKLARVRSHACVSIYLNTTPVSSEVEQAHIEFKNLAKEAHDQLEAAGLDKRELADVMDHLQGVLDDEEFWHQQANSLAVLATPSSVRTYRLANKMTPMAQVSDRFHLKPLLRAITFPQSAFVLALSENAVRLVEVFSDLPPAPVRVANLPKDAASAVGKSTLNKRGAVGRIQGSEGQNVRYQQYARRVDDALRPVLAGRDTPLIVAATGRLASVFQSVCSYHNVLADGINESPDRVSEQELANAARPLIDAHNQSELDGLISLYDQRENQGRATHDMSDAARAATFGAIEALIVDIDSVVPGEIDEETGAVKFSESEDATSYGVIDEIARRALEHGARVLGVRKEDIPGGRKLAAILRFAV